MANKKKVKKPSYLKKCIKQLTSQISENVDKRGVTNDVVERFCFLACGDKYKGTFSADMIPPHFASLSHFIININLGKRKDIRSDIPVGHFITLIADPTKVVYIDSYGLPIFQENVINFLKLCYRPLSYNEQQIQDYNSVYCGLYAILFSCYADKLPPFELKFSQSNRKSNDKKCVFYLRKMFSNTRN